MSPSIYRRGEPVLPTVLQFKFNTRIYMVKEMEIEQFRRTNYSRVDATSKCFTCPYFRGEIRCYPINTLAEAMFFLLQINLR
jgi:uncharacterized protein YwqG